MQGRDVFGALLRLLGVWYFVQVLYVTMFVLMRATHFINGTAQPQEKFVIAFYIVIGFVLLAGADKIVLAIYGPRK
jgi:hypothetical protein